VDSAAIRRRRAAIAIGCGLAIGAFAFGVALGDGEETAPGAPAGDGAVPRFDASQLAGQRIVTGFLGDTLPRAVRTMIREGDVAGVVLYSYTGNLPSRDAGRDLIRSIQAVPRPAGLPDPLLVMIDQEGGLVKRIGGAPEASARVMGERGPRYSREQGRRTARNLRNIGVNVDLAPVLELARPGGDIASDERGFGSTPAAVEETAVPFAEGLEEAGVAATAKHFPGNGAASTNTDESVQTIDRPKSTLRRVDEAPYRGFVAAGGDMVMLTSAIFPAFSDRPAAFTRSIATGELRGRLGFEGVSITDALQTAAVQDFGGPAKAGMAAVRAGADLLLYVEPEAAHAAHAALARGLSSGALSRAAFERSANRVLRLRHRLGPSR
jgi:beta-N-acetylhexosaminidase